METLITYEQDDEPTPNKTSSSSSEGTSFTEKLVQTLKQKSVRPNSSISYLRSIQSRP